MKIYYGYNRLENWLFDQAMSRDYGSQFSLPTFVPISPSTTRHIFDSRVSSSSETSYAGLRKFGSLIRSFWDNRPDSNYISVLHLFANSPSKIVMEGVEELIDYQFVIADKISSGDLSGVDQYSQVERDRVDSIGTKFVYSPGGFQI